MFFEPGEHLLVLWFGYIIIVGVLVVVESMKREFVQFGYTLLPFI